uniref:Uncharacterized protein n=1 Tax=Plectus sambesii TaxID=2011161 RepID=A0A914X8N5_9BILA
MWSRKDNTKNTYNSSYASNNTGNECVRSNHFQEQSAKNVGTDANERYLRRLTLETMMSNNSRKHKTG